MQSALHFLSRTMKTYAPKNSISQGFLVVMIVPPEVENWVDHQDDQSIIRRCAFWRCLMGQPTTTNTTSVTVTLPRQNRFHVDGLRAIFQAIGRKESLK